MGNYDALVVSAHPKNDRLLALYEAEDQYYGRLLGVVYVEIFRSAAPLLVEDPTVFSSVTGLSVFPYCRLL